MTIKEFLKHEFTPLICMRWHIKDHKKFLYIGKGSKIVNAEQMHFSEKVSIMPYTMLLCHNHRSCMSIGRNVEIGMFSRVGCLNQITIKDNVFTGPHVFIADYNHAYEDVDKPIIFQDNKVKSTPRFPNGGILIERDTWIGTNVVIAGTLTIGRHCVIGANSVVTKDIPDYSVAVGVPCRVIRRYNFQTAKWESV